MPALVSSHRTFCNLTRRYMSGSPTSTSSRYPCTCRSKKPTENGAWYVVVTFLCFRAQKLTAGDDLTDSRSDRITRSKHRGPDPLCQSRPRRQTIFAQHAMHTRVSPPWGSPLFSTLKPTFSAFHRLSLGAFVLPNAPIADDTPLTSFAVPGRQGRSQLRG